MAGDWIKMRLELQTHPKVVRILSATKSDKFRVIGGLHAVWSVFDTHSADGRLEGYTSETLDHIIGWNGFSDAMIAVGWLAIDSPESLILPEFDEHNGKSGKRRAEDTKRKRNDRKIPQSVRNLSANESDKNWTREEKRREEEPSSSEQSTDKPKPKKWGTEEDHKAARWVFSLIRKLNPNAREPNWDGWAHDIRLMRESDGRNHHQICEMFKKANADSFWQSNVLSPAKLREKWDQLAVKLNGASIAEPAKIPRREVVL